MIAAILSGIAGTVLYIGSYFWGIFLILGAVLFYLLRMYFLKGREFTVKLLIRSLKKMALPVFGITVAILIGTVIMLATGYNPLKAYAALFYGGLVKNWHVSVLNAVPLIFTGLSVALAFQAGLFNIGAEGQYYIGAMAATWLAIRFGLPFGLFIPVIIIAAGAAAASWNLIPAYLKIKTGAHEVVTTMMFAHIARIFSTIFIRHNGGDPAISKHPYVTYPILDSNWFLRFKSFLPDANYRMHIGILLAILTALLIWFLLNKTVLGFEIRSIGLNPLAARAQGINVKKTIIIALLLAGFLSGCSGINQVLGLEHKMAQDLNAGYGWNGISVALLAGNDPIGVIFTALLWGILDAGGQYMARVTGTTNAVIEIIKGVILFLILAKYIFNYLFVRKRSRNFDKIKTITGGAL